MIRRTLGLVLQRAADWFDDSVSEQTIEAWFQDRWRTFIPGAWNQPPSEDSVSVDLVLREAAQAGLRAGLLTAWPHGLEAQTPGPSADDLASARRWAARTSQRKVVAGGRILPGTGRSLDLLAAVPEHAQLVDDAFESLLRHVEIRRQSALEIERQADDRGVEWVEKHEVAVALSRHAVRTHDLRWLNATFKLNDWAFPVHRSLRPSWQLAHYLRAVAEQEAAAVALCA